ncbi:MAG TPA: hypothetical protein VEH76_14245 [Methylocystis sp.]|nr:hypothetical protein [Methylocystis sp.]
MFRKLAFVLTLGSALAAAPSEVGARAAFGHAFRANGGFIHRHGFSGYYGYGVGGGSFYPYYYDYSDDDAFSNYPYTYYSPYYKR